VKPVSDGSGDGSDRLSRVCPIDGRPLPSRPARFGSGVCRMRARRLRHQVDVDAIDVDALTAELRRRSQLVAACVYECTSCQERYLGERRCPECHLFNRNLGLGGICSGCDQPVVLAELLPGLLLTPTTASTHGPRHTLTPTAAGGVRT
jgi:hypothetical protein